MESDSVSLVLCSLQADVSVKAPCVESIAFGDPVASASPDGRVDLNSSQDFQACFFYFFAVYSLDLQLLLSLLVISGCPIMFRAASGDKNVAKSLVACL